MCFDPRKISSLNEDLPPRFVMAIAGGGSQAIGEFLRRGGKSNTLIEAHSLQAHEATASYLEGKPDHYVSDQTARGLAMSSFHRARTLVGGRAVFGIGATSCLAKIGERDDREHKIHIAVQARDHTRSVSVVLGQGRSRVDEELLNARLIGVAINWGLGRFDDMQPLLTSSDTFDIGSTHASPELIDLVVGYSQTTYRGVAPRYLLSSSCNPLHIGHTSMADWVRENFGQSVMIELCVKNVDKIPLDYTEIADRVRETEDTINNNLNIDDLILTSTGLFSDKAKIFPGTTFVVGTDTIRRINEHPELDDHIKTFRKQGCRFLVFSQSGYNFGPSLLSRRLRRLCTFVKNYPIRP